jgi:hypothetical protein
VLALGILCVGSVVRRKNGIPKRLGTLANVTAASLVALALATVSDTDTPSIVAQPGGRCGARPVAVSVARSSAGTERLGGAEFVDVEGC